MKQLNLYEIINSVRVWGEQRYITGPEGRGTLDSQLDKAQEELDETKHAAMVNDIHQIKDGIGDTTVCLILAAERAGLLFEDCLAAAYDEIRSRTGKMVGDKFVKDVMA